MLTDDFRGHFLGNGTHGTSMWNSACALADGDGVGGMARYVQVLREFLATDLDFDEERFRRYDAESLQRDAKNQWHFRPPWLATASKIEHEEGPATEPVRPVAPRGGPGAAASLEALIAAYLAAVRGDAVADACEELHHRIMAARPVGGASAPVPGGDGAAPALTRTTSELAQFKDFFLKTPTEPGSREMHPCFDVTVKQVGRSIELSTTMTTLCRKSFDLGAKTTDFGTEIEALLPYPCSRAAWEAAGSEIAAELLRKLAPSVASYRLQLPSAQGRGEEAARLEAILGVVGEIWKTTCLGIVKEEGPQGYESERAMMCFVTLHFLLLCLAEKHPRLRAHAVATSRELLELIDSDPHRNLKEDVPDLGRFLPRFLLTGGDAPLKSAGPAIARELFNRNVRWVDQRYWSRPEASARDKEAQVRGTFEGSQFGMKLTIFQSYYILRSAELGLDTISALEACGGRPASDVLRTFQADCRKIKELRSYQEFFEWLQLDRLAAQDPHNMLCAAVVESTKRGYNGKGSSKGGSGKGGGGGKGGAKGRR